MELKNVTVVISGGVSGLGAACARMVIDNGGHAILADINAQQGEALAGELGERCRFVRTDITSEQDAAALFEQAAASGTVRAVVNCAGVAPGEKILGRDGPHALATFERVVRINLVGTFNMLRLGAAAMAGNAPTEDGERGVIINTASIAAFEGQIGQAAYAASKGGVVALTLPAARELARSGIRVMTIAPGVFATPMVSAMSAEVQDSLAKTIPFPSRLGRPEEYALLVKQIFDNRMLNGEVIRLDGATRLAAR
ncbi:MAG TPA: SDR family NAD(P)-dependent oxidoreductase [Noviherbaspirillum sp.]|uniref:SDR family NAD(P)-dependent oxidoreductase n=1 Tax=Noviherbaspirillum sp. TaxID=1926288 RepID=UPI002B4A22D5|nr:SDR family NAD(P)-dependent oxidoreductase [Noviherbaspirillum sp.]HJV84994.1 SDR family NAD(P)-dependent oxidoreductase [Noviherbaspirillum sp.]